MPPTPSFRTKCKPYGVLKVRMFMNPPSYGGSTAASRFNMTKADLPGWRITKLTADSGGIWSWRLPETRMDNCDNVEFLLHGSQFQVQGLETAFWECMGSRLVGIAGVSDTVINNLARG